MESAQAPPKPQPKVELFPPRLVKVYLIALVLVIAAEFIGTVRWTPVTNITILLVPFFHTIYLAVAFAPQLLGRWVKVYSMEDSIWAATIIVTATFPLMARYGTLVGPNVPQLLRAGAALILQEIGNNWGSIAVALPIGIALGLRREVIGACFSVAREPNLSLVGDIYGMDTPEGRGVLGTYITGTVLGTAFFSILGSLFALTSPQIFHPIALGMAAGIGSASMMTAGSATLAAALPEWGDQILAFAAASNLITGVTGLYASWLIGIPFAEWVYRKLGSGREVEAISEGVRRAEKGQERPKIDVSFNMLHVLLISLLVLIGNWVAIQVPPWEALPGILFIIAVCFAGILLARFVPVYVPTIAYIGTLALIMTMPGVPGSAQILEWVNKVNFLALATPIIAFTSLSIAKDLDEFVKSGWRIVLAALITLFSVFITAAIIAEVVLRIQGYPR